MIKMENFETLVTVRKNSKRVRNMYTQFTKDKPLLLEGNVHDFLRNFRRNYYSSYLTTDNVFATSFPPHTNFDILKGKNPIIILKSDVSSKERMILYLVYSSFENSDFVKSSLSAIPNVEIECLKYFDSENHDLNPFVIDIRRSVNTVEAKIKHFNRTLVYEYLLGLRRGLRNIYAAGSNSAKRRLNLQADLWDSNQHMTEYVFRLIQKLILVKDDFATAKLLISLIEGKNDKELDTAILALFDRYKDQLFPFSGNVIMWHFIEGLRKGVQVSY